MRISDWSSDVCSSDLFGARHRRRSDKRRHRRVPECRSDRRSLRDRQLRRSVHRRAGMNQAVFKQIAEIIRTEAEGEPKPQLTDVTPDPETIDRIASLLRKGVCRGIYPQWSLRKALGAEASPENHALIA